MRMVTSFVARLHHGDKREHPPIDESGEHQQDDEEANEGRHGVQGGCASIRTFPLFRRRDQGRGHVCGH